MKTEALIFDMDGTLWDSSESVATSWNEVIADLDDTDIILTSYDIKGIMGLTMDVIADKFFPALCKERRMEIMYMCSEHENDYLMDHGGNLYDDLEKTLKALHENHRLFIVSNCQSGYIESFLKYYNLGKYFTDFSCWGDNHLKKGDNIRLIMERNNITDATYVGDTEGDSESAYYAGAKFIHASYGFGKVSRKDASIKSFSELADVIS